MYFIQYLRKGGRAIYIHWPDEQTVSCEGNIKCSWLYCQARSLWIQLWAVQLSWLWSNMFSQWTFLMWFLFAKVLQQWRQCYDGGKTGSNKIFQLILFFFYACIYLLCDTVCFYFHWYSITFEASLLGWKDWSVTCISDVHVPFVISLIVLLMLPSSPWDVLFTFPIYTCTSQSDWSWIHKLLAWWYSNPHPKPESTKQLLLLFYFFSYLLLILPGYLLWNMYCTTTCNIMLNGLPSSFETFPKYASRFSNVLPLTVPLGLSLELRSLFLPYLSYERVEDIIHEMSKSCRCFEEMTFKLPS